ncbi:MAG: PfkB family carbohydrate kinase [Spirochaetia bacterium]|jgi:sugar/nucleoside kinase (ribokinase family)|nr:PfkB family carbohydrate kinase [Spirochaetia bacterium]
MKSYDIIMMGHVSKDIMIYPDINEEQRFTAGPVVYSSASAAQTGAKVLVITKAAKEDFKDIEYIRGKNIDLEIIESPVSTSIENIYLSADREKRKVTLLSQADSFTEKDIPQEEAKIFHLAGLFKDELPETLITPLAKKASVAIDAQGLLRCSDGGKLLFRDWENKKKYLPLITYLKTDAAEAEILTGTDDREKGARILADLGAREVMVTHNTEVLIYTDGKFYRAPFNPANLSGRTGRGDTCFASYLARHLTHGPEEAVRYAAALTSIKMEKPGRFTGTVEDVLARMK